MRYYFGILIPIFLQEIKRLTGEEYTKEEANMFFKNLFGIRHVSELSEDEMRWFNKKVRLFLAERFYVVAPLAGEPDYRTLTEMTMVEFLNLTLHEKRETVQGIYERRKREALEEENGRRGGISILDKEESRVAGFSKKI